LIYLLIHFIIKLQDSENSSRVVNVMIPLGGNAFITKLGNPDSPEVITDQGLENWINVDSVCSIFFKLRKAETFNVSLRVKVVPSGSSTIRVSITGKESYETRIEGAESYIADIGTFSTDSSGYVQLDIQGISKTGQFFGEVAELLLSNVTGEVIFISDPDLFYFGRRGPSVHFSFDPCTCTEDALEYFYSEVNVPSGQDVIGAYFMANGFADGYFGMQVNSARERRILFSVWSDYDTDDPEEIPEDYRVQLLRKGELVQVNDFGDEGSGKQSILRHNWKAEEIYKFLINGVPVDSDNTKYTAWFCPPGSEWQLIASFLKPKVSTFLSGMYSFSENFIPDEGHIPREVLFGNQWVRTVDGIWKEMIKGRYTGDETSRNGRHDYAGGVSDSGHFFLKNCGFFDEMVETNVEFIRRPTNSPPEVDLENLP